MDNKQYREKLRSVKKVVNKVKSLLQKPHSKKHWTEYTDLTPYYRKTVG